jgi:transcriptional regulator with XRE-family HTH domain
MYFALGHPAPSSIVMPGGAHQMSAFVRIVDRQQFADHFATQGVQVLHGKTTVSIRTAAAIETALGVPVGTLFQPDDAELLGRYLATSS